ncbi:uncharacterized protein LOC117584131 [Drosophila guanche]|nr:uncharacterized protein LOC117584131 [Drosophila guanche]
MLMPVLEYSYNRHIAKIPNCKMRRMTLKAASMRMLLPLLFLQLLLLPCQAVDPAASGGGATGGVGAAAGAVAGSNSLNGGPAGGTLSANLTELGSPGVYNSTNGYNANCNICSIWRICS